MVLSSKNNLSLILSKHQVLAIFAFCLYYTRLAPDRDWGRMTNRPTDVHVDSPCILQDIVLFKSAAQKDLRGWRGKELASIGKRMRRKYRIAEGDSQPNLDMKCRSSEIRESIQNDQ